tara:strand:+ start:2415 stop:2885 length:471 start_codon:yes stop_codon:yes gene_type:complete
MNLTEQLLDLIEGMYQEFPGGPWIHTGSLTPEESKRMDAEALEIFLRSVLEEASSPMSREFDGIHEPKIDKAKKSFSFVYVPTKEHLAPRIRSFGGQMDRLSVEIIFRGLKTSVKVTKVKSDNAKLVKILKNQPSSRWAYSGKSFVHILSRILKNL